MTHPWFSLTTNRILPMSHKIPLLILRVYKAPTKLPNAFGGHLISINISPKNRREGSYAYFVEVGRISHLLLGVRPSHALGVDVRNLSPFAT